MSTNTVQLHRVLRAPPERVYRAFLNPEAMAKWLPPNGFTGKVHEMDPKVGGKYRMSFANFGTGKSHSFGGTYQELVPNERLRYSDKFDDPNLPGEMMTTITLKEIFCGTDLKIVQEEFPMRFPPRRVISAGRNRSFYWRNSSRLRFRIESWETRAPQPSRQARNILLR